MTVVDQWAVLVHKLAAAKAGGTGSQGSATPGQATVYALSGTGRVLEQADLPGSGALAMAVAACSGLNGGVHKVPRIERVGFSRLDELGRDGFARLAAHRPRPPSPPAVSAIGDREPSRWDRLSSSKTTARAR